MDKQTFEEVMSELGMLKVSDSFHNKWIDMVLGRDDILHRTIILIIEELRHNKRFS